MAVAVLVGIGACSSEPTHSMTESQGVLGDDDASVAPADATLDTPCKCKPPDGWTVSTAADAKKCPDSSPDCGFHMCTVVKDSISKDIACSVNIGGSDDSGAVE